MDDQEEAPQSLFRASLQRDSIDLLAIRPLFEGLEPEVSWAFALADVFHHAVDGAVEIGGQDRLRVTTSLREVLSRIARRPHVGSVRTSKPNEPFPSVDPNALTLVHAIQRSDGSVQMTLSGLGWDENGVRQWAQVVFDLIHCVASLESIEASSLFPRVLAEIDQPTTRYRGSRSRVANVLPRGDRVCWVAIPRHRAEVPLLVRLDLSLLARAPIEGLDVALELTASYSPGPHGLAGEAEIARMDTAIRSALKGLPPTDLRLAARTEAQGDATLLFYVRDPALARSMTVRLDGVLPSSSSRVFADQSWSTWLELSPDRDELRRLANWNWLDDLSESGVDVDSAAVVNHVFWSPTAEARDQFAESFEGSAFRVISASDSGSPGRWECIVEHQLQRLVAEIDAVTAELEDRALRAGATYDGWDIRR